MSCIGLFSWDLLIKHTPFDKEGKYSPSRRCSQIILAAGKVCDWRINFKIHVNPHLLQWSSRDFFYMQVNVGRETLLKADLLQLQCTLYEHVYNFSNCICSHGKMCVRDNTRGKRDLIFLLTLQPYTWISRSECTIQFTILTTVILFRTAQWKILVIYSTKNISFFHCLLKWNL